MKTYTITDEQLRKMATDNPSIKKLLIAQFPDAFIGDPVRIMSSGGTAEVTADTTVDGKRLVTVICRRVSGEFKDRGFLLGHDFHWKIEVDADGFTVLVPYRKL